SEAKERWRFAVLGVEDFITKPIVLPDLLKALEELAARSNWRRATVPKREHSSGSTSHSSTPPRSSMTISTSTPPAGIAIRPGKTGST
ncbi:MAG: hypothetical protein HOW73_47470, partial [Polyangiaceae bacterium]|nr:hypothetical protein [Polyangiaceae bacterium]